eukprot:Em0013g378a
MYPKTTSIGIKSEPGKKGWQIESQPIREEPTSSTPSPPAEQNEAPEQHGETVEPPAHKPLEVESGKEEAPVGQDASDAETPAHTTGPETQAHTTGPETQAHTVTDTGSKDKVQSPVSSGAGNETSSHESM